MFFIKSAYAVNIGQTTLSGSGADISKLYNPAESKIKIGSALNSLFSKDLINLVFVIAGLLFFASLVMAGWDYMMSSGDPKKVAGASTRFINSLLGIIMSLVAYLVVRIVLSFLGLGNLI
ncbi:hypothetical protein A3K29_00960 [Candidatus Collierbacteria bacterium RIFOXYB2_FULL_46_14]|uniref:Uncharacterized protein n=1 Tax=Candidatus Collierbacteria bacterium GW2011_GWA2_46_26 TaxID=1618381 RepID=A0A0G1SIZ0_9BACT|nr:MAG: hypothetical protein UW29_C0003G0022 [Candidatus Collierbacteria bacterium GW2011_GWC2_44_13]KKU33280.1 MAG: hypothetical protein UX47_C0005G0082 [Candidatus Collierbacteria bacterium GW2011_GWA2_46_26]OGD72701.1 MAG: hypothetical protein A3K29_00960 [Candidatus Collierbacteria bacterium RIFOXYB2_FULL_46_14]OGD75743.1 MAG: hypothetical protein A3K43_00960 [Candidatus Collierbacteria bacterium RIFOXYA2_FULL_46_20]OGD77079.1 MAG: hypothetical protein A3K39_00960 [Candidatus Collierbacteri